MPIAPIPLEVFIQNRQREFERITAIQPQAVNDSNNNQSGQSQSMTMGRSYDDLPIQDPSDLGYIGQKPAYVVSFESACQHGHVSTVQSIILRQPRTPIFLHNGLVLALKTGNVKTARCLLSAGAPIARQTPRDILLSTPLDQQIPLFELLLFYGWTPNTPGIYGAVLLPKTVTNLPLLRWFLAHGADPNLGQQRFVYDRFGGPNTRSCDALEIAAERGDLEAVRLLLDAGAKIRYGTPLHRAAGACPPGTNIHHARVSPSKEFDTGRIPVMVLLVERGADVNQREGSPNLTPRYALMYAVMAGAVERARWLLEHGADPEAVGWYVSPREFARRTGSEEMKALFEEGPARS